MAEEETQRVVDLEEEVQKKRRAEVLRRWHGHDEPPSGEDDQRVFSD
ncbi:MAG TPA: hypothetical protein VJI74_03840 [Candidatus Paceibacterota bacterium]